MERPEGDGGMGGSTAAGTGSLPDIRVGSNNVEGGNERAVPAGSPANLAETYEGERIFNQEVPIIDPPGQQVASVEGPAKVAAGKDVSLRKGFHFLGIGRKKETTAEEQDGGGRKGGEKKKQKTVSLWRLFQFADKMDYLLMVLGSLGAIASGVARPLMTLLLGSLINAFGQNTNDPSYLYNEVKKVALYFLYLALAAAVSSYCGMAFWTLTGERQSSRIRTKYLKAILRQDIGFFDVETSTGEVVGRMTGDTLMIQDAISEKVEQFIRLMAQSIAGFVIAFLRGWLLTLVLLAAMPLVVFSGAMMMFRITKLAGLGQEAYADAGSLAEQVVGAMRTVVSFAAEQKMVARYRAEIQKAYKVGVRTRAASGVGLGVMLFVLYCTYALALWYGSVLITTQSYSGGDVINVVMAVLIGGMSLGQCSPSLAAFGSGQAAAYKMFGVISRQPPIDNEAEDGEKPPSVSGAIELQDVHFRYPARPEVPIFEGFSLSIAPGTTVALVGESGSGKSTIVSLIERFYDPQQGAVLLDGRNIRSLNVRWLRQQIGLVSQEPALFTSSIKENILYGKEGATLEEIKAAAQAANAHKFISKLPQGYDTKVGERGVSLSGGQKQRIAIARAILKDPRILLLDEATSALDAESEHKVQEALEHVSQGRTTVVVAHRLTTVVGATKIAVLHRGKVVEEGSHRELIGKQGGAYAALVRLQAMVAEKPQKSLAQRSLSMKKSWHEEDEDSMLAPAPSLPAADSPAPHRNLFVQALSFSVSGFHDSRVEPEPEGDKHGHRRRRGLRHVMHRKKGDVESGLAPEKKDVPFSRLIALARPEWLIILLGLFFAGCNGALMPIFALLLSKIINVFFIPDEDKLRSEANFWAGMFVMLAGIALVAIILQYLFFGILGERLIRRVRTLTFRAVVRQEIAWFDDERNSTGAVGSRLASDATSVKGLVGDQLALLVQNGITLAIGFVIAFIASWKLTLVVLAVMPLLIGSGWCQVYVLKGFSAKAKTLYENASQVANDAIGNIRTVAAFGAERKVMELYRSQVALPEKVGERRSHVNGAALAFSSFVSYAVYSLAFWYGGQLVRSGEVTFQEVFQVFFAIALSAQGVSQATAMAPDVGKAKAAIGSIFAIIDRKSAIDSSRDSGRTLTTLKGDVLFRNVDFAYPTRPHIPVFRGMTFDIHAGQTVALVGESGSGKSTAIALIQRFYDPKAGSILIDGHDLRTLQLRWLRQQTGLVSQEPHLFATSIRDNITFGKELATDDEVIAAAKMANAHDFISRLPGGYNTQVGERGVQLSGGQKQRVAIARAVLKDPRILLLDEATSALDAESERVVQAALEKASRGRTTVVVAHRLSTIQNADKIMVVKDGAIAEQGTHSELLRIKGGAYANLVKLHQSSEK